MLFSMPADEFPPAKPANLIATTPQNWQIKNK